MASKQLGRLRQWAGEVISSKEKPIVSEEFKDLEKDIELRKEGIQKLILASEQYHHALSKKKPSLVLDDSEKVLPMDILGTVMILHGEDFREDSPFGTALIKLGKAHCKIATLQEAFALTFKDTFLVSMNRFKDEIKEYETLKKTLETRRTSHDSAATKFDKLQNTKKEKDRREAEEEMERCKQRYDETAEDIRAHIHAIQENEHAQLHELTLFLDLETNFVQSYLEVLKDVKSEWKDRSINHSDNVRSFQYPKRSLTTTPTKGRDNCDSSPDSSSGEGTTSGPFLRQSRSGSTASKTHSAPASRPPSRPTSRLSKKRANSTSVSLHVADDKEKEKVKEKLKDGERSRRMSVADWASNAVESVTGGSKGKKSKDKDSFANLDDLDFAGSMTSPKEGPHDVRRSSSFRNLARRSSKTKEALERILQPPSVKERKIAHALYDFCGSSDELSFKAGDEIVVVQEVLDGWWIGELSGGKRGLFPASHAKVMSPVKKTKSLPAQKRPSASTPKSGSGSFTSTPFDRRTSVLNDHGRDDIQDSEAAKEHDHYMTSDADDDHIIRAVPMAANKTPTFYGGFDDTASLTDTLAEATTDDELGRKSSSQPFASSTFDTGDDDIRWFPTPQHTPSIPPAATPPSLPKRNILKSLDAAQQPLIDKSQSENPGMTHSSGPSLSVVPPTPTANTTCTPTKKIPPPPPPRRTMSHNPSSSPPIPERKPPSSVSSHASNGSLSGSIFGSSTNSISPSNSDSNLIAGTGAGAKLFPVGLTPTSASSIGYDRSPFESSVDLDDGSLDPPQRCEQFRQNPFKPRGICSNCLQFHN